MTTRQIPCWLYCFAMRVTMSGFLPTLGNRETLTLLTYNRPFWKTGYSFRGTIVRAIHNLLKANVPLVDWLHILNHWRSTP